MMQKVGMPRFFSLLFFPPAIFSSRVVCAERGQGRVRRTRLIAPDAGRGCVWLELGVAQESLLQPGWRPAVGRGSGAPWRRYTANGRNPLSLPRPALGPARTPAVRESAAPVQSRLLINRELFGDERPAGARPPRPAPAGGPRGATTGRPACHRHRWPVRQCDSAAMR